MAKEKISETERLRREVSFLRSTLREMESYTAAEAEGVLAHKAGKPRESNPYDRHESLTQWVNWDCGWDNEAHIAAMRMVVESVEAFLLEVGGSLEKSQTKALMKALDGLYKMTAARDEAVGEGRKAHG